MQYYIEEGPKQLRETLCIAQHRLATTEFDARRNRHHIEVLQHLINECDRLRPLGPDGKHGRRHTPTCGCEDK